MVDIQKHDLHNIVLHPVTIADLTQEYLGWLEEASAVLGSGHLPKTISGLRSELRTRHAPPEDYLFAIIANGKHVGNISLHVDLRHGRGQVGVLVGQAYRGRGIAAQAHRLLLEKAFGDLGLRKVWAGYRRDNSPSEALYRSLGFRIEGILRQHDVINNQAVDVVRTGMLSQEWSA
jgi:RimJ/RimL family protein N-acetyltransferase